MTEIEHYDREDVQFDSPMMRWAAEARQVASIAESLCKTSFVPTALRGRPAEITAAILAGAETGMQPIAALRSIHVIQGTPALSAVAMRGLVQSHGHRIRVAEAGTAMVVVRGQRAGEDDVHESVWTIERARDLGLTDKDNWEKQPQSMLVARATAECCRLTAADVLLGMPYAAEELTDVDTSGPPKTARKRTAKRNPLPDTPEPELDEPATVVPHTASTNAATPVETPDVAEWPEVPPPGGDQ